jgi:SM-20-related protein
MASRRIVQWPTRRQKAAMHKDELRLNPDLNVAALADEWPVRRKMQVRDVFDPATAKEIERVLMHETPWGMVLNQGERVATLRDTDVKNLTPDQWAQFGDMIAAGAARGYQYVYDVYTLVPDYFNADRPWTPLFHLLEYVNSPEFLDFGRQITGDDKIVWSDCNPSRFQPGHFLMRHMDDAIGADRRIAFVLNFTSQWGGDWGGYLQFYDEEANIELAFKPAFNVMNLFAIPQDHSVSMIAPFASHPRLSIAGWFRGDQPPKPIGDRSVFGGATA